MTLRLCEIGISSSGSNSRVDDDTSDRDSINGTDVTKVFGKVLEKLAY